MSAGIVPFPVNPLTKPITVTDTASTSTALPAIGNVIRIVNEGPSVAFVSVGTGTQTATLPNATPTATSTPILAGEDAVFSIPNPQPVYNTGAAGSTHPYAPPTPYNISAICRSGGTATLDVAVGEGV